MANKKSSQNWILGHVNWYDPKSGKGSITGDDGIWYRIHEFADIQSKLKDRSRVEFALANDSVNPVVKSIRPTKTKEF